MIDVMPPSERVRLTEDLYSGSPERVASALETLDQAWRRRRFGPLPLPQPDCLAAFGDRVPIEVLSRYLTVLENYPDFEPTPSGSELRHALIEAVIRYGRGAETLDVALALRTDDFPDHAVSDALGYLGDRGLNSPDETLAAQRLVDHLLDSEATRRATVDMLRRWVMVDRLDEVIEAVRPRLDDAERSRLDLARED